MLECLKCHKQFQYNYDYDRHKNRKTPCNATIEKLKCDICKVNFKCNTELERHKKTKKHKNNYNIHIENLNLNITNNNHIHVTIMRGFSETNINVITEEDMYNLLIKETDLYKYVKDSKEEDDDLNYDSNFVICIFNFLIKIFSKLNFNLAYSENHNCLIFSFTKSNTEFIEYQLLEIDNTNRKYYKRTIKYEKFIEEFLNLMKKVNNKFKIISNTTTDANNGNSNNHNELLNNNHNELLDYILYYLDRFKKIIFREGSGLKNSIEKELITSYNEFELSKDKVKTEEEEFQLALTTFRNNAFSHILN
jgi:hypothetical protein